MRRLVRAAGFSATGFSRALESSCGVTSSIRRRRLRRLLIRKERKKKRKEVWQRRLCLSIRRILRRRLPRLLIRKERKKKRGKKKCGGEFVMNFGFKKMRSLDFGLSLSREREKKREKEREKKLETFSLFQRREREET